MCSAISSIKGVALDFDLDLSEPRARERKFQRRNAMDHTIQYHKENKISERMMSQSVCTSCWRTKGKRDLERSASLGDLMRENNYDHLMRKSHVGFLQMQRIKSFLFFCQLNSNHAIDLEQ